MTGGVVRSVAFVGAVVVVAVGAGLGPRHAIKEGATPTAVVGLLLLLVGAVVLLWTAVRLLVSVGRWWRLPLLVVLLTVTYVVVWTLGIAVAASWPPRGSVGSRTPADHGLTFRSVEFRSADGVRLAGWYVPSRNGAAVAVMHGAGQTRTGVLRHAVVLAERRYGVLAFDARGHGESAGRGMDFGWFGEADSAGAVDFLLAQPDVRGGRVGLVGLSMGAEQAIGAAGVDPRVRAVVAEGATARVAEDKGYLDDYGVRGELQQWVDGVTSRFAELLSSAPRPVALRQSVRRATARTDPTPFLLVVAGEAPDEARAARTIRGRATGVEVWTVEGAGHVGGLRTDPAEWERRVTGFLDRTLQVETAR